MGCEVFKAYKGIPRCVSCSGGIVLLLKYEYMIRYAYPISIFQRATRGI
jgi:hypothetical protein